MGAPKIFDEAVASGIVDVLEGVVTVVTGSIKEVGVGMGAVGNGSTLGLPLLSSVVTTVPVVSGIMLVNGAGI